MQFEPVIGFEIHVELRTKSKMFCGCKNDPFGARKPNTYTCPVCLGLPGALPVTNRKAVEYAMLVGLALGCDIPLFSKFDRKHYFYPDLPKGYQISQYDQPLCTNGKVAVLGGDVRIQRVHLEEDTGKLLHTTLGGQKVSLIDFNRSGVPLVEIVTEPDIKNGEHAKAFLKKVHQMIRYLDVSDADMEKGSMRLEPNISLRPAGASALPSYKVEVKNINSFNFVKRAIEYEITRQSALLAKGETPLQENRGWNEEKNATVPQRRKEEAEDYRYFPDPDIPPMRFSEEYIESLRAKLPLLPDAVKASLIEQSSLSEKVVTILVEDVHKLNIFNRVKDHPTIRKIGISQTTVANWIINRITDNSISVDDVVRGIVASKATEMITESVLSTTVDQVLSQNQKAVEDFKKGKQQSLMFLMGQVKRQLPKGDTAQILDALKKALA